MVCCCHLLLPVPLAVATCGHCIARCARAGGEGAAVAPYDAPDAGDDPALEACHTFLQRTLYRINRLNLFWSVREHVHACVHDPYACACAAVPGAGRAMAQEAAGLFAGWLRRTPSLDPPPQV